MELCTRQANSFILSFHYILLFVSKKTVECGRNEWRQFVGKWIFFSRFHNFSYLEVKWFSLPSAGIQMRLMDVSTFKNFYYYPLQEIM